jgi:hypothetical protein
LEAHLEDTLARAVIAAALIHSKIVSVPNLDRPPEYSIEDLRKLREAVDTIYRAITEETP